MKVSEEKQRIAIVGVLLLWCTVLIAYPIYRAHDWLAIWMLWNLFLAVIPLSCSSAFKAANAHKRPVLAGVFFFLWLLFLPNAPYILTDLFHLAPHPPIPLWYILAMLLSCAGTGTLLGYLSLLDVHDVVEQKFGKTMGWVVASGSLMLCGFGIYLGRFLRWNSWNVFTRPVELFKAIIGQFIDSGGQPHPLPVTFVFGVGLIIGYLALRVVALSVRTS